MKLNFIFDNVKIYNVQTEIDVVEGEVFKMEILESDPDIFSNNDQVLSIEGDEVTTEEVGTAIIRFMDGQSVIKDVNVNVVNTTSDTTTDLRGKLGEPVTK